MDYFEPKTFREWFIRVFALRPILIFLFIIGALITEFRFDWAERILGAYLVETNVKRPESGMIWEIGHRNITAQRNLQRIVSDRQSIQREVRDATTFAQVMANITPDRDGVMLSPDHFRALYLGLPPSIAQEIVSPFELMKILSSGEWDRTYFAKIGENLDIYLIDRKNRVIQQIELPSEFLDHFNLQENDQIGILEDFHKFENRIYPAIRFFDALESMSEEIRRSVISHPEGLLEAGNVVRVGISDEAVYGFIELGFEIEIGGQKRVIIHPAPEWAVYLLRSNLEEGKKTLKSSILNEKLDQAE